MEPDDGARESFFGGWNAKRVDDLKAIIDSLSWTRYQYGGTFVTNWVDSADTTNGHVVAYGPVSGFGNEAYHDVWDGSTLGFTQTNWASAQAAALGAYSTNGTLLYPRARNLSRGSVGNELFSATFRWQPVLWLVYSNTQLISVTRWKYTLLAALHH